MQQQKIICPILNNIIRVRLIFENKYKRETFIENATPRERTLLFGAYFKECTFQKVDPKSINVLNWN